MSGMGLRHLALSFLFQKISVFTNVHEGCSLIAEIPNLPTTQLSPAPTSIQDALEQLRELYHAAKKKTKKREASFSQTPEDNKHRDQYDYV